MRRHVVYLPAAVQRRPERHRVSQIAGRGFDLRHAGIHPLRRRHVDAVVAYARRRHYPQLRRRVEKRRVDRVVAEKRIGHLYPKVEVTPEIVRERPDLKQYQGRKLTVIAWLWTRTVKSPNPAFADVEVPLVSNFMLSTKKGYEAYVDPEIDARCYRFKVRAGIPTDLEAAKLGTTAGKRQAFRCLMSGVPVPYDHIRNEGKAGRMGARLMAVVAEGHKGRVYLSPRKEHEATAGRAKPLWKPELALPNNPRDFKTPNYGLHTFADLFTARQLVALTAFSGLVGEAMERVKSDYLGALDPDVPRGNPPPASDDNEPLRDGGKGATA